MKKHISIIFATILLVSGLVSCNKKNVKTEEEKHIIAIFSGIDKQPFSDNEDNLIDTLWIYYSDNTFDQYAEVEKEHILFSQGTYLLKNNAAFIYDSDNPDSVKIEINRTKKYLKSKGLSDYSSTHTYDLYSLGFKQLW